VTKLLVKRLCDNAKIPTRAHNGDAGMDVYAIDNFTIPAREHYCHDIGISTKFNSDHVLLVYNKSGRAVKNALSKGAEVIDSSYRGSIHVHLFNHSDEDVHITTGEKIAQLLLMPIWCGTPEEVDKLDESETERGTGGFGSSGLK